jgi:hypothetical protein
LVAGAKRLEVLVVLFYAFEVVENLAENDFIIQAGSPYGRTFARNRFKTNKRMLGPPDPDSTVPEPDDVCTAVPRQVGQKTRVTLDSPTLRAETDVLDDQLWCLKDAVAVIARDPDPAVPETYDLSTTVSCQIGQETWVTLDPPKPGGKREVREDQLWWARIIARRRDDRGVLVILRDSLILGSKPGSREVLNPELIDRVAR